MSKLATSLAFAVSLTCALVVLSRRHARRVAPRNFTPLQVGANAAHADALPDLDFFFDVNYMSGSVPKPGNTRYGPRMPHLDFFFDVNYMSGSVPKPGAALPMPMPGLDFFFDVAYMSGAAPRAVFGMGPRPVVPNLDFFFDASNV